MTQVMLDMQVAFRRHRSFEISGDGTLRRRSLWSKLYRWHDRRYHEDRVGRIAEVVARLLEQVPRGALEETTLQTTRTFLKRFGRKYRSNEKVQKCILQFLAAKLGIEAKLFDTNPGFEAFAKEPPLEKYLSHYGDGLKIENGDAIHIRYQGEHRPWEEVSAAWEAQPDPIPNSPGSPKQPWRYGPNGVQNKDMYAWKELEPYKRVDNHPWGDRYIFEFCACHGDGIQLNGDHTWLQLKTPTGEVYSVGLYRPGKRNKLENFTFPMRAKQGLMMSPDFSEFYPMSIDRLPVNISLEQFVAIKRSIEEDKANEDRRPFQVFRGNCTEYVNEKAALAGIHLPTSINGFRYIMPKRIAKVGDCVMAYLPKVVRKVCDVFAAVLGNLILHALGGAHIDKAITGVRIVPHLSPLFSLRGLKDLINPDKTRFHPPRYLALEVMPKIKAWREAQIALITKGRPETDLSAVEKEAVEKIRYGLPEGY